MKEYKCGLVSVIVEGENLCVKSTFKKHKFTFSDILSIRWNYAPDSLIGFLSISENTTKKPHLISFQKNAMLEFLELHDLIAVKIGIPCVGVNVMINEKELIVESQNQAERARQLDEEGIAYCPRCLSTSLSLVQESISLRDVMCMKCGHRFNPRG